MVARGHKKIQHGTASRSGPGPAQPDLSYTVTDRESYFSTDYWRAVLKRGAVDVVSKCRRKWHLYGFSGNLGESRLPLCRYTSK